MSATLIFLMLGSAATNSSYWWFDRGPIVSTWIRSYVVPQQRGSASFSRFEIFEYQGHFTATPYWMPHPSAWTEQDEETLVRALSGDALRLSSADVIPITKKYGLFYPVWRTRNTEFLASVPADRVDIKDGVSVAMQRGLGEAPAEFTSPSGDVYLLVNRREAHLPFTALLEVAIFAITVVLPVLWVRAISRCRSLTRDGRCQSCGYPITGLNTCPECGQPVTPPDLVVPSPPSG